MYSMANFDFINMTDTDDLKTYFYTTGEFSVKILFVSVTIV